jgi:hypothetical protein
MRSKGCQDGVGNRAELKPKAGSANHVDKLGVGASVCPSAASYAAGERRTLKLPTGLKPPPGRFNKGTGLLPSRRKRSRGENIKSAFLRQMDECASPFGGSDRV